MTAKVTYTYSGTPLSFNFPSFDKSHIQVSVNNALVSNFTVSNYTTGLSENRVSSGGGGTVTFSPDINVGDTVVIFRATPANIFVNFQDGATLTASELNLNNTAQVFRTDELVLEAGSTPGPQGLAGTVTVSPTTTTGNPGTDASVTNTGTSSAAVLAFTIPRGDAGTPATITSATAVAGTTAGVTVGGTPSARTFEFTLPKGDDGTGFTIKGTLSHTGAPTSTEAPSPVVGDLWIDSNGDGFLYNQSNQWQNVGAIRGPVGPRGDGFTGGSYDSSTGVVTFTSGDNLGFSTGDLRGADGVGTPGTAATIQAGNVTFGSPAAVTNSGTSSAAVFDFTIPQLWTEDSATPANIYYPNNVAIGSNSTNTSYTLHVNGSANVTGALTANSFSGNGAGVSNVNAATLGGSTLSQVLSNSSGSISVGNTANAPSNPSEGDLWWNPDSLRLYVYYDDGTSDQWVDASPPSPGVAPNISIGTVTTLTAGSAADAEITGTTPNLTLNLEIPQGAEGPQGPQGPQGPAGSVSNSVSGNFGITGFYTTSRVGGSGGGIEATADSVFLKCASKSKQINFNHGGDIVAYFDRGAVSAGQIPRLNLGTEVNFILSGSNFPDNLPIELSSQKPNVKIGSSGKLLYTSHANSSLRFKHTVQDYEVEDAVRFLENARPISYYYNFDYDDRQHLGFIAEELEQVEPRYIEYDDDGNPESVDYEMIVTTLTKICQLQEQRIKALEDRLNA